MFYEADETFHSAMIATWNIFEEEVIWIYKIE